MPRSLPAIVRWYGLHLSPYPSEEKLQEVRKELCQNKEISPAFCDQRKNRVAALKDYFGLDIAEKIFHDLLRLRNLNPSQGELLEAIIQAHPKWVAKGLQSSASNLATYILMSYGASINSLPNTLNLEGSLEVMTHWGLNLNNFLLPLGELLQHPSFLSLALRQRKGKAASIVLESYYLSMYRGYKEHDPLLLYWSTVLLLQAGMDSNSLKSSYPLTTDLQALYPSHPLPQITLIIPRSLTSREEVTLSLGYAQGQGLLLALLLLLPNPDTIRVKEIKLLGKTYSQSSKGSNLYDLLGLYDLSELRLVDSLGSRVLPDYRDVLYSHYPEPEINKALPSKEFSVDIHSEIGLYRVQYDHRDFLVGIFQACMILGIPYNEMVSNPRRYVFS